MNKRIKELSEQAELNLELQSLKVEKFSELLIRDCYSVIIKSQRGHFNPATSWDAVKQHFGLQE